MNPSIGLGTMLTCKSLFRGKCMRTHKTVQAIRTFAFFRFAIQIVTCATTHSTYTFVRPVKEA